MQIVYKLKNTRGILLGIFMVLIISFVSLFIGYTQGISINDFTTLLSSDNLSSNQMILLTQRIPRAINAIFVGASLAIAGMLSQTLTKNDLASPSILGVNAVATFFVLLSIVFLPNISNRFIFAFVGAYCGLIITLHLTKLIDVKSSVTVMVIIGLSINILFNSIIQLVIMVSPRLSDQLAVFTIGSLEGKYLQVLKMSWFLFLLAIITVIFYKRKLQVFAISEEKAHSLGINVRNVTLVTSSLIAYFSALAIAIGGPISMIGLVSPHIARKFSNGKIGSMLLWSVFSGIILLQISDVVVRVIDYPREIPVGVLSELFAALFFVYLAIRGNNER